MQHIYQAVITAWMYATPLFYDLDSIKNTTVVFIIKAFNPLYYYVAGFVTWFIKENFRDPGIFGAAGLSLFWLLASDSFISRKYRISLSFISDGGTA